MTIKKTILITGATGGIGRAIATGLAQKGHQLLVVGRNPDKGASLIETLQNATKNPDIHFFECDLSRMADVSKLCAAIRVQFPQLDGIVFSSGVLHAKRTETKEGLEEVFAMQYLNRFLMTVNLADNLTASGNAKVVWIGAPLLPFAKLDFDNLQFKKGYFLPKVMAQVQLAAHVMVQTMASRYKGRFELCVVSPGLVVTDLAKSVGGIFKVLATLFLPLISNSAELAASNVISIFDKPDTDDVTGLFFSKPGNFNKRKRIQFPEQLGERLWAETEAVLASSNP